MVETVNNPNEQSDSDSTNNKRLELVQQRIDLMAQQKSLRDMLEQQERILREKQEEILLQQRLHRQRLEELARIKLNNEQYQQQQEQFRQQQALYHRQEPPVEVNQNLEEIVSAVYKKLINKKKRESPRVEKNQTNSELINDDEEFIELIINEKNLVSGKKQDNDKHNLTGHLECTSNGNEAEESRLIEDLFFLK